MACFEEVEGEQRPNGCECVKCTINTRVETTGALAVLDRDPRGM
jgi:hypothetical protein